MYLYKERKFIEYSKLYIVVLIFYEIYNTSNFFIA